MNLTKHAVPLFIGPRNITKQKKYYSVHRHVKPYFKKQNKGQLTSCSLTFAKPYFVVTKSVEQVIEVVFVQ